MDDQDTGPDFTMEDLLTEIRRKRNLDKWILNGEVADIVPGGIYTTRELSERVGISVEKVREMLRDLHEEGRLETTHKMIPCLGLTKEMKVSAYRLKGGEKWQSE